ncbi:hypothetical protein TVAG_032500 [Trichomonas vaginalis G3]|uniref:Uncharacterized protein n=1 Tax=Trichomonas vaginalis (strain ATCC PRA-98 / G3) TaxID=412133 RepID=A2FIT0_TRIV3|nr:spectrin binding [Trichomonas vaginalis G3]EAX95183.1 hypothetical protein TVAG_032500 [Trichomonas vaginalis G3]KAI5516169.1 spectrin binding [Trichomonas vaginalis G3]|eukprot:XP_001308113.1 hypothetical protein [Trichomonas vaginalis G3]
MFQRHFTKLNDLIRENKDVSQAVQTMTDLSHDFIRFIEFYSLPMDIIEQVLANTKIDFTRKETVFILQNFAYVWRKNNDKLAPAISKYPQGVPGKAIVDLIKDEKSWVPTNNVLPGELSENEPNYLLIQSKQKRALASLQNEFNNEIASLQKQAPILRQGYIDFSNAMEQVQLETKKKLYTAQLLHENKMQEYQALIKKLQERGDELEERINNPISEKEYKIQMNRLEASNKEMKIRLETRIEKEIDTIHDKLASVGQGKSSAELKQEKEQERIEKEIRAKRGIPEEAAGFNIPLKPIPIKVLHPSYEIRKPIKIKNIFDAISMHNFEAMKKFVEEDPDTVYDTNDEDLTPLHLAAKLSLIDFTKYLLEKGADPNAFDKRGFAPIHYAGVRVNTDLIDLLYHNNTEKGLRSKSGQTTLQILQSCEDDKKLLMDAIKDGKLDTIDSILERWPDLVNHSFMQGLRFIHLAAAYGNVKSIEHLLKWDADINQYDYKLDTPLHYAARYQMKEAMQFLLNHGADYKVKDLDGASPFQFLQRTK